jgi:hypothetical protein
MWVFRKDRMRPQESGEGDAPPVRPDSATATKESDYGFRFWYSLDVLVPGIELGIDKAWGPDANNAKYRFVQTYSYFHRIAGWILVPLVAVALSGLVHL